MTRTLAIACLAIIVAACPASADDLKFHKVDVSDGPLLFFVRPEDGKGNYAGSGDARKVETSYLFDPARHRSPHPLWSGANPPMRPVTISHGDARPLPHLLIMERNSRCAIVDLRTGDAQWLDEKLETSVIAVEWKDVYYLQHTLPNEFGGYKLSRDARGVMITESYFRPRDFLYLRNVGEAKPQLVCDTPIERVLAVEPGGFWVITAGSRETPGKDRKLARIARNGKFEAFAAFDDGWVAPATHHAFSPKRKYLAISTLHDRHDFHKERELLVIDLEKKSKAFALEKVNVENNLFSSSTPSLSLDWLDDAHLSVNWLAPRVIDVPKGVELDKPAAARMIEARPEPKEEPRRKTTGLFDHEWGLLYFKGEAEPVASVLDESGTKTSDLEIAPGGQWAAYSKDDLWLVDGKAKRSAWLMAGWGYNLEWLDTPESEPPRPK